MAPINGALVQPNFGNRPEHDGQRLAEPYVVIWCSDGCHVPALAFYLIPVDIRWNKTRVVFHWMSIWMLFECRGALFLLGIDF